MGGNQSKNDPNTDKGIHTTTAPRITPAPCPSDKELHLALAFLAGSLLTLLLMALVVCIIKSYRKYHSSPHALDPHSDSLAKLSSNPEEALTSASMALKTSKEKRDDLNANHSADLNSVIYAQIKLADSS
ncbi:PREDICTED: transmembrane protein C1orf162 homolog isoform X1 [Myotis davidii]|uniref:transmembrane protein C1orf162 homolog isoform X1 n=1 Tax=Myotis davidii TaxID=225400 RepID=UPI0007673105|nr:PREDICTED: transmembrane protein C1orf162 homolog isoform X1 [Myotis davidii]XP_015418917.1 PREDICTED: transmembrane protein C1orf162 homolog isoform X1 [Myotis davidii]